MPGAGDSKVGTAPLCSLFPFVAVVQPTDPRQLNHFTTLVWLRLDRTLKRSIPAEAVVGSVMVVIAEIGSEGASQVTFTQDHYLVQTVSAYRAD